MTQMIIHNTPLAQWHALVNEAQLKSCIALSEDLESYLVFLLMRFMRNVGLDDHKIAIDFLTNVSLSEAQSCDDLQHVGDKCLLFSGLFSDRSTSEHGRARYLIDIGQSAYDTLSNHYSAQNRDLFSQLACEFTSLCHVLTRLGDNENPLSVSDAQSLTNFSVQWVN